MERMHCSTTEFCHLGRRQYLYTGRFADCTGSLCVKTTCGVHGKVCKTNDSIEICSFQGNHRSLSQCGWAWYPFSWQLALPLLRAIVFIPMPKKLGERHLPSFATISDGIASGASSSNVCTDPSIVGRDNVCGLWSCYVRLHDLCAKFWSSPCRSH